MPNIPVSWGEIVDKLTILEIKMALIPEKEKKKVVQLQHQLIWDQLTGGKAEGKNEPVISQSDPDYQELYQINRRLWDCEDLIRVLTRQGNFGSAYIQVSKDIRAWNDDRALIKKKIDQRLASDFWDVKNHPGM